MSESVMNQLLEEGIDKKLAANVHHLTTAMTVFDGTVTLDVIAMELASRQAGFRSEFASLLVLNCLKVAEEYGFVKLTEKGYYYLTEKGQDAYQ